MAWKEAFVIRFQVIASIFAHWLLRKSKKVDVTGNCLGHIGLHVNKPLIDVTWLPYNCR